MATYQEQITELENEELELTRAYPGLTRLEKALDISEGTLFGMGLLCSFFLCFSIRLIFWGISSWNEIYGLLGISYLGGIILGVILPAIFQNKYRSFLFRRYKISKDDYDKIINRRVFIKAERRELESKIKALFELKLEEELNEFITDLKKGRYSSVDATAYLQILKQDFVKVKNNRFVNRTERYYTNRLSTIQQLIRAPHQKVAHDQTSSLPNNLKTHETTQSAIPDSPAIQQQPVPPSSPISSAHVTKAETDLQKEKPFPKEEEKTDDELFGDSNDDIELPQRVKREKPATLIKIDFSKLNEHRRNIGELGEQYIFEKERNQFLSKDEVTRGNEVIHLSLTNDSVGYDIISFTESGERKYIEVKTTTGNEFEPFYLSTAEMEVMKKLNNYWIYRVYNFDIETRKGDCYKIDCSKGLEPHYHVTASTFKVSPRQ